jgi:hypothetical protein
MMFHDQEFLDTLSSRKDCFVKSVDSGESISRFFLFLCLSVFPGRTLVNDLKSR